MENISEKYEISWTEEIHVNLGPLGANWEQTFGKVSATAWIVNEKKFQVSEFTYQKKNYDF